MPPTSSIRTWCKICGITTLADALAAQQAGADALGFVCYAASPRYITPGELVTITQAITATRVALFVNASSAEVAGILRTCEIDLLQFHGDEDEAFCVSFGKPYMKAIRMREDTDVACQAKLFSSAWALLLDAYVPGLHGGTGQQFAWAQWPQLPDQRLVLAGGLGVDNVASAIEQTKPFGVDVSGGVEGPIKGRKDHQKVTKFLQEVRGVGY